MERMDTEASKAGCRRMMSSGLEQWENDEGNDFSYDLLWAITESVWLMEGEEQ